MRTDVLLKVWGCLFVVSIALCLILAGRQLKARSAHSAGSPSSIVVTREAPPPAKSAGPTINWGGAKR